MADDSLDKEPLETPLEEQDEEPGGVVGTIVAICVGLAIVATVFWFKWGRTSDMKYVFDMARIENMAMQQKAETWLDKNWDDAYAQMLIDLSGLLSFSESQEALATKDHILDFVDQKMNTGLGHDLNAWRIWSWQTQLPLHDDYGIFKAQMYGHIDPNLMIFFSNSVEPQVPLSQILIDELVNFHPPLYFPPYAEASEQPLQESDIVYGIVRDGQARAYPHKIVAFHQLIRDDLGQTPLLLAFCHLSRGYFAFEASLDDNMMFLANSGLVYEGSRLIFDEGTQSLFSLIGGHAISGSLGTANSQLTPIPLVATTWSSWLQKYPNTTVMTTETGFTFDYTAEDGPDIVKRDHPVLNTSDLLSDEAVVVCLTLSERQLAVTLDQLAVGSTQYLNSSLIITRDSGNGIRAYGPYSKPLTQNENGMLIDENGLELVENATALAAGDESIARIPVSTMYWRNWFAAYPDSELLSPE